MIVKKEISPEGDGNTVVGLLKVRLKALVKKISPSGDGNFVPFCRYFSANSLRNVYPRQGTETDNPSFRKARRSFTNYIPVRGRKRFSFTRLIRNKS